MNDEISIQGQDIKKTGLTSNALKYFAIIAMLIDHTAVAFVPQTSSLYVLMRFIGRITGPVMFFAAAEGYRRTKNINRYMIRLAVFALLSYFPFVYFESGGILARFDFSKVNVIYTIFLGVTAIRIRRELKNPVIKTLLILVIIMLSVPGDWAYIGILMILVFDNFYGDYKNQALGYCLIAFLGCNVGVLFIQPVSDLISMQSVNFSSPMYENAVINAGLFIPIALVYFYNGGKGKGGRFSKWFFYIFYPLHLLILGFLQSMIK